MQQDIMGAFTARLSALAGFRAFSEHVVRLKASKTQPIFCGELSSLSWDVLFKSYSYPNDFETATRLDKQEAKLIMLSELFYTEREDPRKAPTEQKNNKLQD